MIQGITIEHQHDIKSNHNSLTNEAHLITKMQYEKTKLLT